MALLETCWISSSKRKWYQCHRVARLSVVFLYAHVAAGNMQVLLSMQCKYLVIQPTCDVSPSAQVY